MVHVKKTATLLAIGCSLFISKVSLGQPGSPVFDAGNTAVTVTGFVKSLDEAVRSTTTLAEELSVLKKNAETVAYMKDAIGTVSKYLYNMQEIIDATEMLIEITKTTAEVYKEAYRSGVFSLNEVTRLSDIMTSNLFSAVNYTNRMKKVLDPDQWKMNDAERMKAIDESKSAVQQIRDNVLGIRDNMRGKKEERATKDLLLEKGMISAGEAVLSIASVRTSISEITLGMELKAAIARSTEIPHVNKFDTARSAAAKTTPLFSRMKGLFYILTAIVALIGALRVYRKIHLGEEIGKSIAIWSFSVLMVFILVQIAELMVGF
jgi:hypothetical protein